jgi:putative FmdB family regulatory protein
MPIYEYGCRSCGDEFELLVLGSEAPACPSCGSADLERRLSLPSVSSEGTRRRNLADAKQRRQGERDERTAADHDAMRHYYEEH